jgi:predicted  nucleic acid-binding Zn-ribbon protein
MVSYYHYFRMDLLNVFPDIRLAKLEDNTRISNACLTNLSGNMERIEEDQETWLERNTAAEGEVTVLRERVDLQEATIREQGKRIQRLESGLLVAQELLKLLTDKSPAGAGK